FSKSVELHDKVIGHYIKIKHYQYVGVITARAIPKRHES
ncbi:IS1 family transposase, partial [Escherichia coli]